MSDDDKTSLNEPAWLLNAMRHGNRRVVLEGDTILGRKDGKANGELDPTPVADIVADPSQYGFSVEHGDGGVCKLLPDGAIKRRMKHTPDPFDPKGEVVNKGGDIEIIVKKGVRLTVISNRDDLGHSNRNRTQKGKGDRWSFTYYALDRREPAHTMEGAHREVIPLTSEGKIDVGLVARVVRGVGNPKVVIIRADTGQGKTHFASYVVSANLEQKDQDKILRVVAVSPTKSLSRALSKRLGIGCYLDYDTDKGAPYYIPGHAVFCAPSMQRSVTYDNEQDGDGEGSWKGVDPAGILILDESEQIGRLLGDGPSNSILAGNALHALSTQIREAHSVLCLDAHAGRVTAEILKQSGVAPEDVLYIDTPRNKPRDVFDYKGARAGLVDAILDHARKGGRPAVLVHSLALSENIGKLARDLGLTPCIYTADTAQEYDLSNINEWITDYDLLVYSPAMATGVSIDVDHFTRLYAILENNLGGTTRDSIQQQLDRVRPLMDSPVHLWARAGVTPEPWEADPDRAWSHWRGRLRASDAAVRLWPDAIEKQKRTDDSAFNQLVCWTRAAEVERGRGWAVQDFIRDQAARGAKVIEVVPDDPARVKRVAADLRKVAEETKVEQRQAIIDAEAADDDLAAAVKRRGAQSSEEKYAVARRYIERFYGPDVPVSHALLIFDDKGRGRAACRSLVHALAFVAKGEPRERVRELDRREHDLQIPTTKLRHNSSHAAGEALLLVRAGLADPLIQWIEGGVSQHFPKDRDPLSTSSAVTPLPATIEVDLDKARELAEWVSQPKVKRALGSLGITVRKDVTESPMQFIGSVLKRIGIKLQSKQHRVNGVRTRTYWIDKADFDLVWSYAAAYRDRLLTGALVQSTSTEDDDADPFDQHLARQRVNQAITEAGLEALLS